MTPSQAKQQYDAQGYVIRGEKHVKLELITVQLGSEMSSLAYNLELC